MRVICIGVTLADAPQLSSGRMVVPPGAGVAQLVEQLIRNQQVTCSSHVAGSSFKSTTYTRAPSTELLPTRCEFVVRRRRPARRHQTSAGYRWLQFAALIADRRMTLACTTPGLVLENGVRPSRKNTALC